MDLKLPPLGEGADDSGNVVSILVKEGDQIAKGQGIIELETGKAVAPVPASAAGKVTKIIVAVGDKISVGQPILSLDDAGPVPAAKPVPVTPVPDKAVQVVAGLNELPQGAPCGTKRIEFLFELYDKYTADLFTKEKPVKNKKTKT